MQTKTEPVVTPIQARIQRLFRAGLISFTEATCLLGAVQDASKNKKEFAKRYGTLARKLLEIQE